MTPDKTYLFPAWTNRLRVIGAVVGVLVVVYVAVVITFGFSPQATDVGYQPKQPVPYSHAIHAGDLGLDCRYCHTTVETSAHAAIPSTQICMNCHANVYIEEARKWKIDPVKQSYSDGTPIPWIRVHDLPDYVYFNHSAHVTRGVGCVSCHGRVDKMDEVYKAEPLSMQWCLDCHRNPEPHLRPLDRITDMNWTPPEPLDDFGRQLREELNINPSTDCSTCHR